MSRLWEIASLETGHDIEICRQVYLFQGMGYTQEESARALQLAKETVNEICQVFKNVSLALAPKDQVEQAISDYLVVADVVKDELLELYTDQKKNYKALGQGQTRHPDGTVVRRVKAQDIIAVLGAIDKQAAQIASARLKLVSARASVEKHAQQIGTGEEGTNPEDLTEEITDADFKPIQS